MSQLVRAYLPATLPDLARLRQQGTLAATEAYAVTAALREELAEDDDEQLSYAAFRLAAEAALDRLRADPSAPPRRVVLSADVPVVGDPAGGDGAVRPAAPVPLAAVAAIHVDGVAAEAEVAAAVAAARAAQGGSGTGEVIVDHELEWYDVSELAQLLG